LHTDPTRFFRERKKERKQESKKARKKERKEGRNKERKREREREREIFFGHVPARPLKFITINTKPSEQKFVIICREINK